MSKASYLQLVPLFQICEACEADYPPQTRGRRQQRATCSPACRAWLRFNPGVRRVIGTCEHCGETVGRAGKKYCSERCGEVARGEALAEPYAPRRCALPECDQEFQPRQREQRCCSERHGKLLYNRESRADGRQAREPWGDARRDRYHRRRARKKAATTGNPVRFSEIAERDGYRCYLCEQPVDMKLTWPDPLSPSMDHVMPLSKGGTHDPSNVRLSHLSCNLRKGTSEIEELMLTG